MKKYLLSILLISFGIGQTNVIIVDIDTVLVNYGLYSPTTTPIAYNWQSGFSVVIRNNYNLTTYRSENGLSWKMNDYFFVDGPRYPSTTLSNDGAMITTWVSWFENSRAFFRFEYLNTSSIEEFPYDVTSFVIKPQLLEDDDNWYLHSLSEDYYHNDEYYHPLTIQKTGGYQFNAQ